MVACHRSTKDVMIWAYKWLVWGVLIVLFLYTFSHVPSPRGIVQLEVGEDGQVGESLHENKKRVLLSRLKEKDNNEQVGVCSTEKRLNTMKHFCRVEKVEERFLYKFRREKKLRQYRQGRRTDEDDTKIVDWLDELPDEEVLRLSSELWMDPFHGMLFCLHAKAGSTTWKAILGNNSMESAFSVPSVPAIHVNFATRGIRPADHGGDVQEIKHRLRTWYKVAVVRHPFDRLVSSFNDKVLAERPELPSANLSKQIRDTIIAQYHPSNQGGDVLFQDFIQLILDGYKNDHWNGPYEDKCHACLLDYDYIVKLETQSHDSARVILNKLRGRGLETHYNNLRPPSGKELLSATGRDLSSYFSKLTGSQYEQIREKYSTDLGMYGYDFDAATFAATCRTNGTEGGKRCC